MALVQYIVVEVVIGIVEVVHCNQMAFWSLTAAHTVGMEVPIGTVFEGLQHVLVDVAPIPSEVAEESPELPTMVQH